MTEKLFTKSIHAKLFELQQKIGGIEKDSQNPFFKSKYFDINALIGQLKPMLKDQKLLLLQPLITNEHGQNGVQSMIVEVETGESVQSFVALPDIQDPQKMGSAITYYRRYGLASLLGLQAVDDDANLASGKVDKKPAAQKPPQRGPVSDEPKITDEQADILEDLIQKADRSKVSQETLDKIKKESLTMSKKRAGEAIDFLFKNQ